MAFVSSITRARIIADITTKEAQIAAANDTLTSMLSQEFEEYKFNSNEGMQQVRQRRLDELLKLIEHLEAHVNLLYRRLSGKAVHNLNVRRKNYLGRFTHRNR